MSLIKSFSVGNGDMYYVDHNSDNFTIIDCCLPDDRMGSILVEVDSRARAKGIVRFVSTHPDQDHISGLVELDDALSLRNFYCVANATTKESPTTDLYRYCELHDDPQKAFHLYRNCTRRWMNQSTEERGTSGLSILWPITSTEEHQSALADAAAGMPPNNISCILKYSLENGVNALWMGDLETDFMEKLEKHIDLPSVDVLFAPHHGRTSGKVPSKWLAQAAPSLIIVGEAPSEYLDYYRGYTTITQNSAGDVLLDCRHGRVDVYASSHTYTCDGLYDDGLDYSEGLYYVGTLWTKDGG